MTSLDQYVQAATRNSTRQSYAQGVRHFEQEWGGLLPATSEAVARYLAAFAESLSINTLRLRLSAISAWHTQLGFVDPTRDDLVRRTMKGIRALHGTAEKQAKPLQLEDLERVDQQCARAAADGLSRGKRKDALRAQRDRALVLLGFWRAFRSDELVALRIEHIEIQPGKGMKLFLPKSKSDRANLGRTLTVPALSRLCPVEAVGTWIKACQAEDGPLFRGITRWGTLAPEALAAGSIVPLLRQALADAGVDHAARYSSHSLRRGFAGWAAASGWDMKTLMQYVGWRDVQSAARYIDAAIDDKTRIEAALAQTAKPGADPAAPARAGLAASPTTVTLEVTTKLTSFSGRTRGVQAARRHIEEVVLGRLGAQRHRSDRDRYQIALPAEADDGTLTERIGDLIDALHEVATQNQCYLEARVRNPKTGETWD